MSWLNAGLALGGAALGWLSNRSANKQSEKNQREQLKGQKELNRQGQQLSLDTWNKTNYPQQVEQMKKAGLNPALMYGMGSGGGGQLGAGGGGAAGQAQAHKMETPDMVQLGLMKAQKDLIEAQTTKTEAEAAKTAGVDTKEAEARTIDLTQGVESKKAQQALAEAQTALQNINNEDLLESRQDRMDYIQWEAKKAYRLLGVAEDEAYISRETREEKIKQINEQTVSAYLTNISLKENIKLTKQEIISLAAETAQKWETLAQGWKNLDNNERNTRVQEMQYELNQKRPNLLNIGGSAIRETLENFDAVLGQYRKRW